MEQDMWLHALNARMQKLKRTILFKDNVRAKTETKLNNFNS